MMMIMIMMMIYYKRKGDNFWLWDDENGVPTYKGG